MPKQTSIEWLMKIASHRDIDKFDWEDAIKMHKEEIVSAYRIGNTDDGCKPEQYYQETYGGQDA